jgi:hypothetical protein
VSFLKDDVLSLETIGAQGSYHTIRCLTIAKPGQFTFRADLQSRTDKARVKDVLTFEKPLTVLHRMKFAPRQICEVTVANNRFDKPITNLRVTFSARQVDIARILRQDEFASAFLLFDEMPTSIFILWDMPIVSNCGQEVPISEGVAIRAAPITLKVTDIPRSVRYLEPFQATITIQNNEKMSLSGEITIRSGAVVLWGLNKLQFVNLGPGGSVDLRASFLPVEEGKLIFPQFVIAISGGLQLECDAGSGVFVIDRIE